MRLLGRCMMAAAVIAVLFVKQATAANIDVFNSKADFTAATTGTVTVDFNGIANPNSAVSFGSGPATFSGATISVNGSMFVIDPGYYRWAYPDDPDYLGSSYPDGFLSAAHGTVNLNVITIALPAGVTAFGMDFGGLFGPADTFTITASGPSFSESRVLGPVSDSILHTSSLAFIGFTSDEVISQIIIEAEEYPNGNAIDNIVFGTAATVPEPSSLALLGLGAVGLAIRACHRLRITA